MSIELIIQANTRAITELTQVLKALQQGAIQQIQTPVCAEREADPVELQAPVLVEPVPAPEAEVTMALLRDAFINMGQVCGKDAQLKVLQEFGAKKLGEMDPAQFAAAHQVISMMVEAANG